MKWYEPKANSERTVRKFAWTPTQLDDEYSPVVWLEYYYERQVYGYNSYLAQNKWTAVRQTQDDTLFEFWNNEDKKYGWGMYSNTI